MTTSVESYLMVAGPTAVSVLGLIQRIDGYYAEEHRVRVRTTEYPVESGADLTDHVVREPYRLKLKGSATEYQQGSQAGLQAWAEVLGHINARQPVSVVTRLGIYQNMIMVDAKPVIDESTGLSLDIEIELKEILRANVTRGSVRSGGRQRPGQRWTGAARHRAGAHSPSACLQTWRSTTSTARLPNPCRSRRQRKAPH